MVKITLLRRTCQISPFVDLTGLSLTGLQTGPTWISCLTWTSWSGTRMDPGTRTMLKIFSTLAPTLYIINLSALETFKLEVKPLDKILTIWTWGIQTKCIFKFLILEMFIVNSIGQGHWSRNYKHLRNIKLFLIRPGIRYANPWIPAHTSIGWCCLLVLWNGYGRPLKAPPTNPQT